MKCPVCGAGKLVRDTRDEPYTYKGVSMIIPALSGDYCSACGEVILDMDEAKRMGDFMEAFHKKINASMVDPVFIEKVRKKLKLDQQEAAKIFGGGVNAFSRYENGKTKPPVSLVKLLQVLDRHPDLLREIRAS